MGFERKISTVIVEPQFHQALPVINEVKEEIPQFKNFPNIHNPTPAETNLLEILAKPSHDQPLPAKYNSMENKPLDVRKQEMRSYNPFEVLLFIIEFLIFYLV